MRRRHLTPRRLLTLLIAALLFTSLVKLETAAAIAGPPRRLLMWLLSPLQQPVHAFSNWARGEEGSPIPAGDVNQLQQLNQQLAQRVAQLEDEIRVARQRIAELAAVRSDWAQQLRKVQLIDAGVTAWQGGAAPTLTINRGSSHGLAPGQAVTSGASLVGRVSSVGAGTATVSLINQPGQLLDVRLKAPRAEAVGGAGATGASGAPGTGSAAAISPGAGGREVRLQLEAEKGKEILTAVAARGDPIQPGDLAHLRLAEGVAATDSRWPDEAAGFVVGQVVRTEDDPNDPKLRIRVIVQPLRELRRLTRVMVLVRE